MVLEGKMSMLDFSKLLMVSRTTLYNWDKSGKLVGLSEVTEGGRVYKYYTQEHINIIKKWGTKESLVLELKGY